MIAAGIMSGTSLDGIDVAIVRIEGTGWETRVKLLQFHTEPYSPAVRSALMAVSNCETHTREIARLHFLLPELYAAAFEKARGKRRVALIGCHGQTIFHEGAPARVLGRRIASTLQIGDGSVLAERTGVAVVSDFRTRDVAAGGRGAPLVPFVDYLAFRHSQRGRVLLNLGGIGNITWIPAGARPGDVVAFDTGPGNMVMDQLVAHYTGGRRGFDTSGRWAARGQVNEAVLRTLLRNPYYRAKPPKTAGREQYGGEFIARLLGAGLTPEDTLATATALTAATVAEGIHRFAPGAAEIIVSGGGAHNLTLIDMLRQRLPHSLLRRTSELGWPEDAKEAMAFAVLAYETWHGRPSNLPSATGAKKPVILGKISPRGQRR